MVAWFCRCCAGRLYDANVFSRNVEAVVYLSAFCPRTAFDRLQLTASCRRDHQHFHWCELGRAGGPPRLNSPVTGGLLVRAQPEKPNFLVIPSVLDSRHAAPD